MANDRDRYYLTDADRRLIKDAIRFAHSRSPAPALNSQPLAVNSPYNDDNSTPEMYVALTGEGGIPAATPESSEVLIPGSALCDVHFLNRKSVDQISVVEGLQYTVYNLSSTDIPPKSWIPIWRDKYGHWFTQVISISSADTGTGTSTSTSDDNPYVCDGYRVRCINGYLRLEICNNGDWEYAGDLGTPCNRRYTPVASGTGTLPEPDEQIPTVFNIVAKACLRLATCISVSESYIITDPDLFSVEADATSANILITLPIWDSALRFCVVKIDASAHLVRVRANGGTINGASEYILDAQWDAAEFIPRCDGSGWFVLGNQGRVGTGTGA